MCIRDRVRSGSSPELTTREKHTRECFVVADVYKRQRNKNAEAFLKICDINYERESSMKTILDLIVEELKPAFTGCGYDEKYIRVTVSNRPDLCEYQCNGAMAAAKAYKKKPIDIANEVVEKTAGSKMFSEINAVMPGFINIRLNPCYLASYVQQVAEDEKLGLNAAEKPETIIIDYGGANVAKPLHVGHLRSAVIGESICLLYTSRCV